MVHEDYDLNGTERLEATGIDVDVCEQKGSRKRGGPAMCVCAYGQWRFAVPGDVQEHRRRHRVHDAFYAEHGWAPWSPWEFRWDARNAMLRDGEKYPPAQAILLAGSDYYMARHVQPNLGHGMVEPFLLHLRTDARWRQWLEAVSSQFTRAETEIRKMEELLERAKVAGIEAEMMAPPIKWHEAAAIAARLEALPPVAYEVPHGPRLLPGQSA